jgi:cellulose synthase/poly-beta-1,6-N-acetylglucosamine synthase-like glycosyltransferase
MNKKQTTWQTRRMRHFSTLAGRQRKAPITGHYAVAFKSLSSQDRRAYRHWTRIVSYGALLLTLGLAFILFQPAHWIAVQQPASPTNTLNIIMLGCLALLQIFLIVGTYSATRSTVKAKNPIPVHPPKGLRVAFATTRAPGEPVPLVRKTLEAMKRVHYKNGKVDVWLLDETMDPQLWDICIELGVRYFSRAGIAEWNTPKPPNRSLGHKFQNYARYVLSLGRKPLPSTVDNPDPFLAAKSKHGNFNSWRAYLKQHNIRYDILAGVDTDQVPEHNFLQRLLGYFHDPDVAYVVGPQVYGNYRPGMSGLVARWAESQASFFQSTIQRAGNDSTSAMFVGTNYAVRMRVLDQINGFQPCITEDMATGLAIHTRRNKKTGNRWKSVYTPDVLAIGEGPDLWGPYFTQQWRWAAGTFDTWRRVVWRVFFKLSPKAMLHYFLMLTFYPITALTWLLGITSTLIYLGSGATAILAPWAEFVSLYMMSLIMQLSLYFWNRRFNVSPHEPQGSLGVAGMVLTSITAPIYLSALVGVVLGKKAHFIVTAKGGAEQNHEALRTFKISLVWAATLLAAITYGFASGHDHPAMLVWAAVQLAVCIVPPLLGWAVWMPARMKKALQARRLMPTGGESNA